MNIFSVIISVSMYRNEYIYSKYLVYYFLVKGIVCKIIAIALKQILQ